MTHIDNGTIHYRDELVRKLIHLFSLSIPVIYYFIPKQTALIILASLTILALIIDGGRFISKSFAKLFYKLFGFLLRRHELDNEKKNLTGATYVLLSALICVLIFPKVIFVTAFAILIISDSMAALIGRRYGRRKFLRKSFEGTLSFFISASVVVFFTPKVGNFPMEYVIGFIAAFVGAIVENISFGYADDNLTIPLSTGFTMWLLYLIIFPNLELVLLNVPR
ncbi:MAG: SEC59/DGK1/VTE5 family protein [Ignavibacterium sp.]|jgi:dolichol kinase|nr:MAG: dolichol kinase [Ignavibacterium sp.]MCZ7610477.1 SEC59/DGK1/VTE5 family protein [Ignavibacterium sp.]MDX9712261.1 SEC59/DGK1/VTE5 family protein [Ignavibacteriaceae bacterium]GIK22321.1 MAG: phosphatidate cytidylyltransferase [Ignavibacteriota bacterium]